MAGAAVGAKHLSRFAWLAKLFLKSQVAFLQTNFDKCFALTFLSLHRKRDTIEV